MGKFFRVASVFLALCALAFALTAVFKPTLFNNSNQDNVIELPMPDDTEEPDTEEPGTDTEEPGADTEEPGTDTEEPDTEEPGTDTEEPGADTEEPGTDTEEPGADTEEPGGILPPSTWEPLT